MTNTNDRKSGDQKSQPSQAQHGNTGSANKQMGGDSAHKGNPAQAGNDAGHAKPVPPQQQAKHAPQHDAAKSAPEPMKKDAKAS